MNEETYWNLLNDDLRLALIQWLMVCYPHIVKEFFDNLPKEREQ